MTPEERAQATHDGLAEIWRVRFPRPGEGVAAMAAAIREAVAEEREACAQIAEHHESPFAQEHPDEAFRSRLEMIVLQALFDGSALAHDDDSQPERHVAEEVWRFLQTGRTRHDEFVDDTLGATCASREIRQRAAPAVAARPPAAPPEGA